MARPNVFLNSLSGTALYATLAGIAFVMSPVLVRHLGAERYGIWELMLGLVGYVGLLDFGVSPAVVRYVALSQGAGDRAALQRVFGAGLAFCCATCLIGAGLIALAAIDPSRVFNAHAQPTPELRLAALLLALAFGCGCVRSAFTCYLFGLQAHVVVNSFRIASAVTQAAAVYAILVLNVERPLAALAAVLVCEALVEALFFAFLLRRREPWLSFKPKATAAALRGLFAFGGKSAAVMSAATMMRSGLLYILAHTAGVGQVMFFVFPLRVVEYSQTLGTVVGIPLTPLFANAIGRGGGVITQTWRTTTRTLQFLLFGVAFGVAWLGLPFLARWIGPEYAEQGRVAFYILCVGVFAQALAVNGMRLLFSVGRHGGVAAFTLPFALVCLAAAFPLAHLYGIAGIAVASVAFSVGQSAVELRLACRQLGISTVSHVKEALARYALPMIVGSGAMIVCRQQGYPSAYFEIIVHAVVGGATYAMTCAMVAVSSRERSAMWLALKSHARST